MNLIDYFANVMADYRTAQQMIQEIEADEEPFYEPDPNNIEWENGAERRDRLGESDPG